MEFGAEDNETWLTKGVTTLTSEDKEIAASKVRNLVGKILSQLPDKHLLSEDLIRKHPKLAD